MMTTFLLAALLATPAADASTWTGFRGDGSGQSTQGPLPLRWSPTEGIAWKAELPGYGQSSPVVWKGRVFLTAVDGPQREKGFVLGIDARTGKTLWTHRFEPTQKAKWSYTVARAAPTPAVDADGIYAMFEGGNLLALSHDGKPLWSRSLFQEYGEFQIGHGYAASLAQSDDSLFALVDHPGPSYLLAVDKKTGVNRWKVERASRSSWASPVVARRNGKTEVIVSSAGSVAGYDAATGQRLWELDGFGGNNKTSATVIDNQVIVSAEGRSGRRRPAPADGEARPERPRQRDAAPIDPKVIARSNCCVRLTEREGKTIPAVAWTAEKATASYASPLVHRGLVYFVNAVGVVFCHDLATGKEIYSERIDGVCWASPIAAGEHLYFFGRDGRTTVLRAGPKFERVASNALWKPAEDRAAPTESEGAAESERGGDRFRDPILYGAAAANGALFLRTGSHLIRIGTP